MNEEKDPSLDSPVIAVVGDDELGKRQAVDGLRSRFLGEGENDEVVLDGASTDVEELGRAVLEEVGTRPLMGGCKMVIVRQGDDFLKKKKDLILGILDNPKAFSRLVVVARSFGPGRSKVQSRLKTLRACLRFSRPADRVAPWKRGRREEDTDLNRWVEDRARQKSLRLAPGVAAALTRRTGSSLEELDSILERWKLMQEGGVCVSIEAVEALGPRHGDSDSFSLVDAVMRRDRLRALEILTCLFEAGMVMKNKRILKVGDMIPLLNSVFLGRLRQAARARRLLSSGLGRESLESELGIKPFLVAQVVETAGRFSDEELRFGIHRLLEADRDLKFRRQDPKEVLVDLILDVTRGGPAPYPVRI